MSQLRGCGLIQISMYRPVGRWDGQVDNLSLSNALVVQNETSTDDAVAPVKSERMKSLDAFRGLVIIVMIYVDNAGGAFSGVLGHIGWNGVHFADFVMPFFLFIVGLSSVLSQRNANKEGSRLQLVWTTFKRCFKLFILGMLVQNGHPYDLSKIRIFGILQRIAMAQFIVTLIEVSVRPRSVVDAQGDEDTSSFFRFYKAYAFHWAATGGVLIVYVLALYATPGISATPGMTCSAGLSTPECNGAFYWDTKILTLDHMYDGPTYRRLPECSSCSPRTCPRPDAPAWCARPFDPEGPTTTLAAVGSVWFGAFIAHVLLRTQDADPAIVVRERTRQLLSFGLFFLSLGVLLHITDAIPFNKNLFSLSYISMMAGASSLCLLIFWYLIDVKSIEKPFLPFIWQGMNAIFVFVLCACNVFDQIMQNFYWKSLDQNALDIFNAYLQDKCGVDGARVLYAFIKIAFWSVICGLLARFKIFFKV